MIRLLIVVAGIALFRSTAGAQDGKRDSTFVTGACSPGTTPKVNWDSVVTDPEVPVRPTRESVFRFPQELLGEDGGYSGVATASMVVDASGRVVEGTVSIESSTDHKLSAWLCDAVSKARFEPAREKGRPVVSMFQQPYRYLMPPKNPVTPPR